MENIWLTLFVIMVVVGAAVTDFRKQKIPNILTFPSMVVGIAGHSLVHGWQGLGFSLSGLGLGLILLLGFYAMGGMAAGDVKLMAAVGSFLGPLNIFLVFLMTAILGGFYSLGMMIHVLGFRGMLEHVGGMFKTLFLTGRIKLAFAGNAESEVKLRYGLVIALGTLTFQFWFWIGIG
ncbi:A24 family peptidase [Candidatus Nitronereus thalassa]|uniref:A24 family peptidase n=1 Tax=Candidatus Nitronereus thalassa TaxID=3020898 RepID=A0ABU3K3Q1_9BACT|nr:A24 family peptidase [Candidatus Nitronereus thalassa]MDT7041000.1 A24 family peptidase [Candidatus Nitronereus thalassa]